MATEERVKFTKLIVSEVVAFMFAMVLSWSLTYLVIGALYLFASNEIATGKKFLVNQAFEEWLFTFIVFLSLLIIYLWRFGYYKEQINEWKSKDESYSIVKLISIGIGIGLVTFALLELYELIFVKLYGESYFPPDFWLEHKNSPFWQRGLTFLTLTVFSSICYELFFRQMIFGNILREGFTKTAYLFSVLIFCLSGFVTKYLLFIVLMGFILAFLYQKTRSVILPITAQITLSSCLYYSIIFGNL